ncbi:aspartate aminotransferase, partial [Lasius niger]
MTDNRRSYFDPLCDGEAKQSSSATAGVEVNLPADVIEEPDQKGTQPTVLTEKSEVQVRTGESSVSPVPNTSGVLDSARAKPKRYRSVSREIGKGPEDEVLFRSVLEVVGDSEDSGDE